VAALTARTEGWAAGLQLAALSLQGQADVAGFAASFSGSHRCVLDYLGEEVLERQSEDMREFLLQTSVLERLCGGLCDAITGRTDSQAMFEQVERANLSWSRLMRCAAGGATTSCSPTCSGPACTSTIAIGCRHCTGPRPLGRRSTGIPTTPCGMRWPPGTPNGRRG
jgi:hypothetical protein